MSGKEAESINGTSSEKTSRWMVAALVVAAAIFVFKFIAPQTVGEQLRRHVEQKLREHYEGLEVTIGRGRVEPNIGLILNDIRFAIPSPDSASEPPDPSSLAAKLGIMRSDSRQMLQIEQIVVFANINVQKLMEREMPIDTQRILVSGVQGNVWLNTDETVSLERLWPPPKFGKVACPRMEVRDAKLIIENDSDGIRPIEVDLDQAVVLTHSGPLPVIDAQGNVTMPPSGTGSDSNDDANRSTTGNNPQEVAASNGVGSSGQATQPAVTRSTKVTARGTATFADHFGLQIDQVGGQTEVRAEIRGMRVASDLIDRLPGAVKQRLQAVRGLELLCDTSAAARIQPDRPLNFAVRSKVHDGRYRDPRSSMPVKKIRGIVTCRPEGIEIAAGQAYWGEARIQVDGNSTGYAFPPTASLDLSVENLMLDQRLAAILPEKLERAWTKFQPHGLIDVPSATLAFKGTEIKTRAEVICKGVDVNYDKFPYPVRHATGKLVIENHRAKSKLMSGRIGGRLMRCIFDVPTKPLELDDPIALGKKDFSLNLDGPIAIDGELLQALTPRGEETSKLETFVRSLNPLGAVHLVGGTLRTDENGVKHQDLELKVSDSALRFEKFPYPLSNVGGDIRVKNGTVLLTGFHGSNANGGMVRCSGAYQIPPTDAVTAPPPRASGMPSLSLEFDAVRVALDKALRDSLPEDSQKTWDNLGPSGVLDYLNIVLTRQTAQSPIELSVAGRQVDSKRIGSDTLRIKPTALPYRLDIMDGNVRYEGGQVLIDSIRAEHGASVVSADGTCQRSPVDGRWHLSVDLHTGSRVIPDAELTNALPEELRAAIRGLNLRGPVRMSGLTDTTLSDSLHPDPEFEWDLTLQLEGNRIGDVGPVHGLRGEIVIVGTKNKEGLRADGEVRIDSMHVYDLQVTQLRGPFHLTNDDEFDELRLGDYGTAGTFNRPITGRLFDGVIKMDGNVELPTADFKVRLTLENAQVPVLLAELGQGNSDLTGKMFSTMTLEGRLGTTDLLHGQGRATVEKANLYQLPFLVQLLNVLSISPTEDVAFTNMDVDFRLAEEELFFDDLKLWGSLIALYGQGTLDRRRNLDLSLNTRVSPRNTFTRVFGGLMDQRYTLWTIDVTGPLDDPQIERRALDGVGQTIDLLFPGMNSSQAAPKKRERTAGIRGMLPQR